MIDVSKTNEQTNKIKLPSDVIVEAFDKAWEKQNGEPPNIKVFEKIFLAMALKDIYQDILKFAFSDDKEISITYQIKEKTKKV